ncbi:hypothetical protein K466DRAFT_602183 [Polyporus arcularius HHB13444]|uniref:F-box domain-containing protein n=1 Tax=Polyporus arcularius HHB13444 TaxID=1314778 RepID=A0A5C3P7M1_9APHY|nr:hypothetical protein K466DRAFT_602183 [Polyporus arcularius HHB13444]
MATLDHLPPSVVHQICGRLDFPTLIKLRRTSHFYLASVSEHLQDTLTSHIAPFARDPSSLLDLVTQLGGYVGGDVALAQLLRDMEIRPTHLELFLPTGRTAWKHLQNNLIEVQGATQQPAKSHPSSISLSLLPAHAAIREGPGTRAAVLFTTSTGAILVYRSQTGDALLPITQQWGSHRVAYTNRLYSGCGYPRLLFRRRVLMGTTPSDRIARRLGQEDISVVIKRDTRRGFDIRLSPRQWCDMEVDGCGAMVFLCPAQRRSILDAGSLCVRTSPLQTDILKTRVEWRMSLRPCVGGCLGIGAWSAITHHETILNG